MKTRIIKGELYVPDNFTGIFECDNGTKRWYQNDRLHRLDGPATEWSCGEKGYWVLGWQLTKEQFEVFQFLWKSTFLERTDELMKVFVKLTIAEPKYNKLRGKLVIRK